jgi:hypothetical protein
MTRSVLAVVAGLVVMSVTVTIGNRCLTQFFRGTESAESAVAPIVPMILELVWTVFCAILGGYMTARIARRAPHIHAAVLALIVLVVAIVIGLMGGGGPIPAWFRVLLPIFSAFGILTGGLRVHPKPAPAQA